MDPTMIIAAILQAMIQGPKIIAKLNAGAMTAEEAEKAWDETVAPGWLNAYNNWKSTPDGADAV